jgi:hypothetical protein
MRVKVKERRKLVCTVTYKSCLKALCDNQKIKIKHVLTQFL